MGHNRLLHSALSRIIAGRGLYTSLWLFLGQIKCAKPTTLWVKYLASSKTKNWDIETLLQLHHSWHHIPVSFYSTEVDRHIWTALGHWAVHCCMGRKTGWGWIHLLFSLFPCMSYILKLNPWLQHWGISQYSVLQLRTEGKNLFLSWELMDSV